MPKKIAFFDIDGVIYDGHSIFDLIRDQEKRGFIKKGLWDKIMVEIDIYKKGERSYKDSANDMLSDYATFIKGMNYEDLLADASDFFAKDTSKFLKYFTDIRSRLLKEYDVYLVTTNVRFITEALARILGIKNFICSEFEVNKGIISGRVKMTLAGNKDIVSGVMKKYGKTGSIAVGDSENDIDMLRQVDVPVVFEPDNKLKKYAVTHSWTIANRHNAYQTLLGLL